MTSTTELPVTLSPIEAYNQAFDEALDKHSQECIDKMKAINFRKLDDNVSLIRVAMLEFYTSMRGAQMQLEQDMRNEKQLA